ncbi:WxL protein peptidoglycan domain-containing protein [Lacticaseibacillus saniviri]
MKRQWWIWIIVFIGLIGISQPNAVSAAGKGMYAVQYLPTKEQRNKDLSYFDMNVVGNHEYQLRARVLNIGTKPLTITAQVTNGYTNKNGRISYDQANRKLVNGSHGLEGMVTSKKKISVRLQPGKSQEISFTLKTPALNSKGIYAGSILTASDIGSDDSSNFQIKNRIQFATGIVFHYGTGEPLPKLSVDSPAVKLVDGQSQVQFDLTNAASINTRNLQLKGTIDRISGKKKHVKSFDYPDYSLAPQSKMTVSVPTNRLKPGTYRLHVTGKAKNPASVTKTMTFHVYQGGVTRTKRELTKNPSNKLLLWLAAILVIALIGSAGWLLHQRQKNKKGGE